MAYYLTVTAGADEGRTFRVEPGDCIIGRAPTSTIVIDDESIAWEHAMLREDDGRLVLQNLAAQGTRVKGRRITDDVKLSSNDEIALSDQCTVVVHQRLRPGAKPMSRRTTLVLAVAALLIGAGGVTAWALRPQPPPPPPLTDAHWRRAFNRLDTRMTEWTRGRVFPREALTVFQEAWRLEKALNYEAAAARWDQMRALLLTLPFPEPGDDTRIAEHAGPSQKALRVMMGRDQASSTDFRWNTNDAYADALVWFVRYRVDACRQRAEA